MGRLVLAYVASPVGRLSVIVQAGRFSEDALAWFDGLQVALSTAIGAQMSVIDAGADT